MKQIHKIPFVDGIIFLPHFVFDHYFLFITASLFSDFSSHILLNDKHITLEIWLSETAFPFAGGDVVILYASVYNDVSTIVNLSGRFDLKKGIEERIGEGSIDRINKEGYLDVKDKSGMNGV